MQVKLIWYFVKSQKPQWGAVLLSVLLYESVVRYLSTHRQQWIFEWEYKRWQGFEYTMLFSDGRPAPLLKGQIRRQKQREEFAVRLLWCFVLADISFKEKLECFKCLHLCARLEESSVSQCRGGWRDEAVAAEEGRGETERRACEILIAQT